jgi:hypothetical protein
MLFLRYQEVQRQQSWPVEKPNISDFGKPKLNPDKTALSRRDNPIVAWHEVLGTANPEVFSEPIYAALLL